MKMDYDLLRDILLITERETDGRKTFSVSDFAELEIEANEVSYHISLLLDAGYLCAEKFSVLGLGYQDFIVKRITFAGHQYLDTIRSNSVWDKTKEKLVAVGGTASISVVKDLAVQVSRQMLGL